MKTTSKAFDKFPKKPCRYCEGMGHWSFQCFQKPRKGIEPESRMAKKQRISTATRWFRQNPPDQDGYWYCYLRISSMCPVKLTRRLVTLEHVYPKVKRPDLKYNTRNIKPACPFCNKLKGSRTVQQLSKAFPHLAEMIATPEWQAWEASLPVIKWWWICVEAVTWSAIYDSHQIRFSLWRVRFNSLSQIVLQSD